MAFRNRAESSDGGQDLRRDADPGELEGDSIQPARREQGKGRQREHVERYVGMRFRMALLLMAGGRVQDHVALCRRDQYEHDAKVQGEAEDVRRVQEPQERPRPELPQHTARPVGGCRNRRPRPRGCQSR